MGRNARLKRERREQRIDAAERVYTKDQVDAMLREAYRQGWEARNKDIKMAVRQEVAKRVDDLYRRYDACMIAGIRGATGYGKIRLKRIYMMFFKYHKQLRDYYETDDILAFEPDEIMKEIGIDLEAWQQEAERKYG